METTKYQPEYDAVEIDVRELFKTLWRYRRAIVLITLGAMVLAGVLSKYVMSPVYQSSAVVEINPPPLVGSDLPLDNAATYAQVLKSDQVLSDIVRRLGLQSDPRYGPEQLRERIRTEVPKDTQLIAVTVEDEDPERAVAIAQAACEELRKSIESYLTERLELLVRAVEEQISYQHEVIMKEVVKENWGKFAGSDMSSVLAYSRVLRHQDVLVSLEEKKNYLDAVYRSGLVEKCVTARIGDVPTEPIKPRTTLNVAVAGVLGLMLSVFAVLFYEYMRREPVSEETASAFGGTNA